MRTSEWINLFFLTFLIIVAWFRTLKLRRRFVITALGAAGIGLTLSGVYCSRWWPSSATALIRDLLPSFLMLIVYWQSGRFFVKPNESLQNFLMNLDERLIGPLYPRLANGANGANGANREGRSWLANFLEFCYLLCYPLVPLGVIVLHLARLEPHVDGYWTIVLISTYLCYCLLPFVQMLPPRALAPPTERGLNPHRLRLLNLAVLRYASIQVNTFPSAHVASTFAASLVLLGLAPAAGVIYLIIALGIAGGAFLGRYHY
ncbi:MAG: phosphatase PAP2 family protein, partial [Blastocatellia bacterium]|nr:phosphatase PAP2 family protein [Blastocatellia bacterium]